MPYSSSVTSAGASAATGLSAASPLAAGSTLGVVASPQSLLAGAPSAAAAIGIPPLQSPQQVLGFIITMMMQFMMTMMQQRLGGGTGLSNLAAPTQIFPPAINPLALTARVPVAAAPAAVAPSQFYGLISDANPADQQQLRTFIDQIARDPEGLKLLQVAAAKNVNIEIGSPDNDQNVLGVTITRGNQSDIIIRNQPTMLETLIHELGHAVTPENGNSRTEEGAVEALAAEITRRIGGASDNQGLSLREVADRKSILPAYRALGLNNGILNDLAALGLTVFA